MKTCRLCNQDFPATNEYFRLSGKYMRTECRSCGNLLRKIHYYDNIEHSRKRVQAYKRNNPDVVSRHNQKRKALKLGNIHEYYTEDQVLEVYGHDCYLCSKEIDLNAPRRSGIPGWENGLHIDHLVALSKGGPDTLENVRPSHGKCNLLKYNKEQYEVQTA